MTRWLAWLPLGALALLAVLFAGYALKHDPKFVPDALVGQPVPAVSLPTLEGGAAKPVRTILQGPTFINIFASWCAPCIEEAPTLAAMRQGGARIIGIATRDDPAATRVFLERYGNPFNEILVDRDGRASIEFGASGFPETFLVNPGGVIVAKHSGALSMSDVEAMLRKAEAQIR